MKQQLTHISEHSLTRLTLVFLLVTGICGLLFGKDFPEPVGYVNDFAKVIEPEMAQKIEQICTEIEAKTGAQITVATFPDMGGDEIDGFTVKLFEQWKIGKKGKDNGILIVNAMAERQVRIEVGYGLEPIITDAITGRIRRDEMNPLLKAGRYGEAYLLAISELASIIQKGGEKNDEQEQRRGRPFHLNLFIPVIIIIILSLFRRRRNSTWGGRGGPWIGGGGFGGFGGGGGGGGGGFGGFGGGGSGGGGSSGGY